MTTQYCIIIECVRINRHGDTRWAYRVTTADGVIEGTKATRADAWQAARGIARRQG